MNIPYLKEGSLIISLSALTVTGSYYLIKYIQCQQSKLDDIHQYVLMRKSKEEEKKSSSYF